MPSDAVAALKALEDLLHTEDADGACKTSGSIIDCGNQILGEAFPVRGTPFSLHYSSDRVPGRKAAYTLKLHVLPVPKPASLKRIDVTSYGVDGLNRRVSKSAGGVLQRAWAWDGARIVAEFDGAGSMTTRFVYGTRPQVPDYMIQGGQVYRILTDHLGSVRLVVRLSDGAIAQELAYDPWGAVEKDTSPGLQPFGFAGGVYDPDTRLVRFGARDYDPAIGRWTAKDPSGLSGGTNLYAYAEDDPVNLVDLTGENPVFFLLAGAMEGIAGDLFFQMVIQGKRTGCVDGTELAIAGVMGALSGGLGAPAAAEVPQLGGAYSKVRTLASEARLGGQVHHMPSWAATSDAAMAGMTKGNAPAIWMEAADHALTGSHGRHGAAGALYRSGLECGLTGSMYLI